MKKTTIKDLSIEQVELVNKVTGDVHDGHISIKEELDMNYHKTWWLTVRSKLSRLKGEGKDFAFWLFSRTTSNNRIIGTVESLSRSSKVSLSTVKRTLKILEEDDVIYREVKEVIVNPDVTFRGTAAQRKVRRFEYQRLKDRQKGKQDTDV